MPVLFLHPWIQCIDIPFVLFLCFLIKLAKNCSFIVVVGFECQDYTSLFHTWNNLWRIELICSLNEFERCLCFCCVSGSTNSS